MRFSFTLTRAEYDFLVRWMSDSWPQFPTDRRTSSNVPPWFFVEHFPIALVRRHLRLILP